MEMSQVFVVEKPYIYGNELKMLAISFRYDCFRSSARGQTRAFVM